MDLPTRLTMAMKPFPCDDVSASNFMNMVPPVELILPGKVLPTIVARLVSATDVPVLMFQKKNFSFHCSFTI